jgi:hypothetical protein
MTLTGIALSLGVREFRRPVIVISTADSRSTLNWRDTVMVVREENLRELE